MRILNCYSGLGANRKLWTPNSNEHEITAIELDPKIAEIYKDYFPNDTVLVEDAHEYLLNHHKEYDFIWASPPCQTHSSFRHNLCVRFRGTKAEYPDMRLYQEIIFLQKHFKGKWVVENVKPYYEPLVNPTAILQRHYFWSNFDIPVKKFNESKIRTAQIPDLEKQHGFNLQKYSLKNKRQILRNCVLPEVGKHILDSAINNIQGKLF